MHDYDVVSDAVWHKHVMLKVYICAWRLFRNRLPTKDNLQRRGVISLDGQSCVAGCGHNEIAEHLIIHCPTFGSLWQLVKSWQGLYLVDPLHVMDHFQQFIYASGGQISRRSFLHMIWLCCIWVFWMKGTISCFLIMSNQLCNWWKR